MEERKIQLLIVFTPKSGIKSYVLLPNRPQLRTAQECIERLRADSSQLVQEGKVVTPIRYGEQSLAVWQWVEGEELDKRYCVSVSPGKIELIPFDTDSECLDEIDKRFKRIQAKHPGGNGWVRENTDWYNNVFSWNHQIWENRFVQFQLFQI